MNLCLWDMVTDYSLVLDPDGEGILADMMLDSRNYTIFLNYFILFFKTFYFILEYNKCYNINNVLIVSDA